MPLADLLVENSTYHFTHGSSKHLLKGLIKPCGREECSLSEWRGLPVLLLIHHCNGVAIDQRLINLQLLCPSCHAQTNLFKGKNQVNRLAGVVE